MTHNPCLTCLNASIDFPSFYNLLASHKKHITAHALAWPYPSDLHKATLVFPDNKHWSVRTPTRPVHLLSSSARSPLSLPLSVTHCGFLEYIFGQLNSWCSASQLLLALTQTATNW
ncbi:unnamed protein product [Hymenolepis diminuta]|nr:unnamed protein product [Hymenolepis diminuta]